MDDNFNNDSLNEENNEFQGEEGAETAFGSSEYYKKLYDDMPEDVAEMLIGTHPLMSKEVSNELTHNMKIRTAKAKYRRAAEDDTDLYSYSNDSEADISKSEHIVPSKDPVDENENTDESFTLDDVTSFTRGLVSAPATKSYKEPEIEPEEYNSDEIPTEEKSESDITAEKIAQMLGGGNVTPVDESEYEEFEIEDTDRELPIEEKTSRKRRAKRTDENEDRPLRKRKHKRIEEKDLELSNIDKQANLNELFREDDDYYDEKHAGSSVMRIAIIAVIAVIFIFLIYKVASLSGQVSSLNEQIKTYQTMEQDYEELKLENLSLTEQVQSLGGGNTNSSEATENNTNATETGNSENSTTNTGSSTTGSTTYTVQSGDTYWGIATKLYGNGSYYTRILSANGLTENDTISVGTVLTIPAL